MSDIPSCPVPCSTSSSAHVLGETIYDALLQGRVNDVTEARVVLVADGDGRFMVELVPYRSANDPRHALLCDILKWVRARRRAEQETPPHVLAQQLVGNTGIYDDLEKRIVELTATNLSAKKAEGLTAVKRSTDDKEARGSEEVRDAE